LLSIVVDCLVTFVDEVLLVELELAVLFNNTVNIVFSLFILAMALDYAFLGNKEGKIKSVLLTLCFVDSFPFLT
jgi:hypothetical protein